MSKLRRQRKTRTRVDRIEWRSTTCESSIAKSGFCRHSPMLSEVHHSDFSSYADHVLSMSDPSMEHLASVACARTREVIHHPMTQLYKLVDPFWFRRVCFYLNSSGYETPPGMRTFSRSRRRHFLAFESLRKAIYRFSKVGPDVVCGSMSSRRALKLARRFRRKAREAKVAKVRDKYGRPRS